MHKAFLAINKKKMKAKQKWAKGTDRLVTEKEMQMACTSRKSFRLTTEMQDKISKCYLGHSF